MLFFDVRTLDHNTIAISRNGLTVELGVHWDSAVAVLFISGGGIMFAARDIEWNSSTQTIGESRGRIPALWIGDEGKMLLKRSGLASDEDLMAYHVMAPIARKSSYSLPDRWRIETSGV